MRLAERFLNHSCQPNCELFFWETDDLTPNDRLWLQALRPIEPGEELTIDYAWPADAAIRCACGAAGYLPRIDIAEGPPLWARWSASGTRALAAS